MDGVQLVVQIIVGLGSGALGALIGARAQLRLDEVRVRRERQRALWSLERELRMTGERLMDLRAGKPESDLLREAEREAVQYLPDLPDDLRFALESDETASARANFEIGENLVEKANWLRRFLDSR